MKKKNSYPIILLIGVLSSCQTTFTGLNSGLLGLSMAPRQMGTRAASLATSSVSTVSAGGFATNTGKIIVDGTGTDGIFQYTKDDHPNKNNLNMCFYGMAALVPDAKDATKMVAADNATLINDGTIDLYYHHFVEKYKDQTKLEQSDPQIYDNLMGWGMLAGNNSTVINNGTINMYYDANVDYAYALFSHPLYVGDNSSMINNGKINILGNGSKGAQIRGITSSHSNLIVENNGLLYINVGNAYMARGIATTGTGSTLTNNGTLYMNTSSVAYGIAQNGGNASVNNGVLEVITKGYTPKKAISGIFPVFTAGAYAFADLGSQVSKGTYSNYGIVNVRVEGDSETDPYSSANGMMFIGTRPNAEARHITNLGIINLFSTVSANDGNENQYLTSEVGINTAYTKNTDQHVTVKVGKWATTLRDFSTTKDLFNGRNGTFDFSETELILRPSDDYVAGTKYSVSQSALVNNVTFSSAATNELKVVGFENLKFSTEMPEFLEVDVTNDHQASLELTNDKESVKSMVGNTVMNNIDFVRSVMNTIDRIVEYNDELTNYFFVTPYVGHLNRESSIGGSTYGMLAGGSWKAGKAISLGAHAGYGWANGTGSFYQADSEITSLQAGVHAQYMLPIHNMYVRGQVSGFFNGGRNRYTVNNTGVAIQGKSENDVKGIYASVMAGNIFPLSEQSNIQAELGASSMNMFNLPQVQWNLLSQQIEGYKMDFGNKYRSVYMRGLVSWNHEIKYNEACHKFSIGGGIRGKLFADNIAMNMLQTSFAHKFSEDNQAGIVSFSYHWSKNDYQIDCTYNGDFGNQVSANMFTFTIGKAF